MEIERFFKNVRGILYDNSDEVREAYLRDKQ
jgi:hypothetical protein